METAKNLEKIGIFDAEVTAFKNEEDGEDYAVWKVSTPEKVFVLKEAKEYEAKIYADFLSTENDFAPRLYNSLSIEDKDYLLMEYVSGDTMMKADRKKLVLALDALISMQKKFWQNAELDSVGLTFEKSLEGRINRGKYLNDEKLERTYEEFIEIYKTLPRTFCHDDLLPFNVMVSEEKAVIIDWEAAGLLPYPVSLARLIAHGEESEDAFFYMTNEDKEFAVRYYYDNLLKEKDIDYEKYRKVFDYFLFYEYCEWVMLGNKYGNTESERFLRYLALAKQKAKDIQEKPHE